MKVVRASIFCIRYMPTLRAPVRGSFVITAGQRDERRRVARPAALDREQVEVDVVAGRARPPGTAPLRTDLRHRVGDRLQLRRGRAPSRRGPAAAAARARPRAARRRSSSRSTPKARHMRRSVPNWLIEQRVRGALRALEEERGPAGLDGAVDDLGDLEVRIDLGGDADELALALEQGDPVAQVRRRGHAAESSFSPCASTSPAAAAASSAAMSCARSARAAYEVRTSGSTCATRTGCGGRSRAARRSSTSPRSTASTRPRRARGGQRRRDAERAGRVPRGRACGASSIPRAARRAGPCPGASATEEDLPPEWELVDPVQADEARVGAARARRRGLDAVVVNPTTPVGEGDTRADADRAHGARRRERPLPRLRGTAA